MKKALLLLALAPIFASAQIRGTVLNDLMRKSNVSVLDAAAAMVIANAVGMDPMALIREVRPYGVTVYESAPAWWISHEYHRPFPDIYRMKRSGKGWGVIAHELGMNPGTFNKLRKQGAFDRYCWVDMSRNNGWTDNDWSRYRGRGLDDRDVVIAYAMGGGDKHRVDSIVNDRMKSGSWDVPGHGRVKSSEAWGKGHSSDKSSNGKGVGKGNGKGKGGSAHGQGKGNAGGGKGKGGGADGHGKGHGGGDSPGQGHGNGKGHGHG